VKLGEMTTFCGYLCSILTGNCVSDVSVEVNCSDQIIIFNRRLRAMLSGSTVTTAWRVLGLRIEETASRYGR
jgi:hypothetical protein